MGSVTVVSCVYGDRFDRFVPQWVAAISALDPAPDDIIVASDCFRGIPGEYEIVGPTYWEHAQAFHLHRAARVASTDWVWFVDIDDLALSDALRGLDEVQADVWQMGYIREGHEYVVPDISGRTYLGLPGNPFTAGSAVRTKAFRSVGGFRDVAFQDWGLWRRLAKAGATFQSSGRVHYEYRRHADTRSALELVPGLRAHHEEEMVASEL